MRDPYEVLGVSKTATDAEIKKAYRRLARKHHPDVNPGDTSAQKKFQEIAAAYEVLKEPERRRRFDASGDPGFPSGAPGAAPGGGFPWGGGARGRSVRFSGDLSDLFSDLFSGLGAGGSAEEEEDATSSLTVPFREAVQGGTVTFRTRISRRCGRCGGTGATGRTRCPQCHGSGSVVENERLSVRIPAGVDTGSKIRVPGKGRTENGDLYLDLTVETHPYFRREGDDIHAEVPLTLPEAYLGADIDVPTIHGLVRAKIPAGTATGQRFRLKGRGVASARTGSRGDHYYKVTIAPPTETSEEGRQLVESLSRLYRKSPRSDLPTGL
jgi:molecular chaperone DnaJ